MSSALTGKLEADAEINASPDQFHDMVANRPHHLHHASYDKVQGCDLHEGEWGKVGTVVIWRYVHDGKAKVTKDVIEAIDHDKKLVTFRALEGDKVKEYKSLLVTVQASPKIGGGSVVHWTLEYEKLHDAVAPESFLQFLVDLSKDMDAHLTQSN
ncbi:MLP-like protein 28 [Hibiscus syriacus]|uniref:MLP-like protein 28 n=1 Tax=Hibiscus syriacus TaxID=106335 RepID=A0A6A3BSJ3_HIBSY|nr:MLP-like protein 31 [Hibiscus syriacus]KAE8719633.1 MLP-like protein 28 [Hibiscus syriacus]